MKLSTGIGILIIGAFIALLLFSATNDKETPILEDENIKEKVDKFEKKLEETASAAVKIDSKELVSSVKDKLEEVKVEYKKIRTLDNSEKIEFLESKLSSLQEYFNEKKDIVVDKFNEGKEQYQNDKEIYETTEIVVINDVDSKKTKKGTTKK